MVGDLVLVELHQGLGLLRSRLMHFIELVLQVYGAGVDFMSSQAFLHIAAHQKFLDLLLVELSTFLDCGI